MPKTPVSKSPSRSSTRRTFLRGAALASAATVCAPAVVSAQGPISMRWQSTWPSKDIFHEYALDYAKKVNDMTGGDLKIEVLPAGAVVPDAVTSLHTPPFTLSPLPLACPGAVSPT